LNNKKKLPLIDKEEAVSLLLLVFVLLLLLSLLLFFVFQQQGMNIEIPFHAMPKTKVGALLHGGSAWHVVLFESSRRRSFDRE
jgi:hypothetical protein